MSNNVKNLNSFQNYPQEFNSSDLNRKRFRLNSGLDIYLSYGNAPGLCSLTHSIQHISRTNCDMH